MTEFEKTVQSVLGKLTQKEDTDIGDIVLIFQDIQFVFAVITDIKSNINNHHQKWWDITFKVLSVPLNTVTWTLRPEQMTGKESFTMRGMDVFFAPIQINTPLNTPQAKPELFVVPKTNLADTSIHKKGKPVLRLVVDNTKK